MATTNEIYSLYLAYFGRPPDAVGFAAAQSKSVAQLQSEFSASAESAALLGSTNLATQVNNIYVNAFGRSAETAGLLYWVGEIAANRVTLSQAAFTIVSSALNDDRTTVTNKITAATAFYAQVVASPANIIGYSGNAASAQARTFLSSVTSSAASVTAAVAGVAAAVTSTVAAGSAATVTPGSTFTLTAGTDNRTGTAGGDTFDAGLSATNQQTLNSGDRLDGGTGNDSLLATITASVTPTALTSIEDVTVTVTTNASTLDLANSTGVVSVTSAGSTAATTLSGISAAVGVSLRDSAVAHTITFNNVTGSADSATVNVSNMNQATTVATSILGIETLTLNATTNDATLGLLTATQATALNVTGTKALNIVDNLEANIVTVNASTNSGGVNLDFGAGALTVTGGSGNDDFSFEAAGNVSVAGGAGNDTFRFDATGTLTTADTVNGGDGDADTLRARSEELDDFTATPTTFTITNIERVTADTAVLAGATISVGNISATANRLNLTAANAGAATFNFNAGASTLSNAAATVGAITVDAAGSATTDSLTIVHGGASAVNSLNGQALTSTDFETVTINTTGTGVAGAQTVGAVSVTASSGGTPTLAVTGSNQLTTGVVTITGGAISASGMTGATGLIMTTGQNDANSITGSSGADTLFGAITTGRNQTIDGGSGNDSITAGGGNDSLVGGDGDDTVTGGAGNDNINGGAGNDRIVVATTTLTSADTAVGGDGTDTLAFAALVDADDSAAILQAVSGFEVLELAAAASRTITLSNFINNQTFTRVDIADGGGNTFTVNNAAAAVTDVRLLTGINADSLVFRRLVDNSSNALTISHRGGTATVGTLNVTDEETLSISGNSATDDLTVTTFTSGDLRTLTISGAGDVVLGASGSTALATVNASAATGVVTASAASSLVSVTFTGGSGANTFTGGVIADSLTGGSSTDALVGGAGNDTINGVDGNDSITGDAGADVINVGAGTDQIIYLADTGESTTITSLTNPISLSTTTTDLITGMTAGDTILLGSVIGYTATDTDTTAGDNEIQTAASTTALSNNGVTLLRGSYSNGIFLGNTSGADTLLVFDTDQAAATTSYQAVVLVGTAGVSGTVAEVGTSNTFTITLG